MAKLSAHLDSSEIVCKCGCGRSNITQKAINLFEAVRHELGDKPLYITSGCRCPTHSVKVGGYANDYHVRGMAFDVYGKHCTPEQICAAAEKCGANGIGLLDIVENRLVGMKCRGVYETPGGAILYKAHNVLETICLDKETAHYKQLVAHKLGELVYNAQWFTPLTEAILSFVKTTQKTVTGDVTLKLYKGNMINAGVTSPYSLYDPEIATFDEDDVYDQAESAGFINLYGLSTKVYAKMKAKNNIK